MDNAMTAERRSRIDPKNRAIIRSADYSDEEMHAALDVNIPNYASAIVTTDQMVDSISSL